MEGAEAADTLQGGARSGPVGTGERSLSDELRSVTVDQLVEVDRRHYELLGEFARGGLGRILRARDRRTGRVVAIKEILRGGDDIAVRFAREALVTANLQHPSIVPVYELGRWPSGEPFYAMKLVKGRSLEDLVAETRTTADRIALLPHVIDVAEALAYAHGERVIHRDLKPANVLVGAYGETIVIDWGLAKNLATGEETAALPPTRSPAADPGDTGATVVGTIMGTPAYMPPEQARGDAVDERADVYAIGAILYQVLAGERPYPDARSADEVLDRVLEGPPRSLRAVDPELPEELIAVVEQAMATSPAARYATAKGLAEDLVRFQTGKLVQAHHYGAGELLARWLRRHRAMVATAAAALLVLAALGLFSVRRIASERDEARRQRHEAERQRASAQGAQGVAERSVAELQEELARQLLLAGDPERALAYLAPALAARPTGAPSLRFLAGRAIAAFAPLAAIAPSHTAGTASAELTPDGALLVTAGFDQTLRGWDVAAGRTRWSVPGPAFARVSPDGAWILAAGAAGVTIVDAASGRVLADRPVPGAEPMLRLAISPDGSRVAAGGGAGTIALWRREGLEPIAFVPHAHAARIGKIAFSPDGARLAAGAEDGLVTLWDAATGARLATLRGHRERVNDVAWLPGDRLVSASNDGAAVIWDLAGGRPLRRLEHGGWLNGATPDAGGARVVTYSTDTSVIVWDAATGERLAVLGDHPHGASSAAFVPGERLATADEDGVLRLWDLTTGALLWRTPATGTTFSLTVGASGQLVMAGRQASVSIWRADAAPDAVALRGHVGRVRRAFFDDTGRSVVTVSNDGTARIWDGDTGALELGVGAATPEREAPAPEGGPGPPTAHGLRWAVMAPLGDALVTTAEDGAVTVWDVRSGRALRRMVGHTGRVRQATFDPGGTRLVTAGADATARIWDFASGRELARVAAGAPLQAARFTQDGRRLVTLGEERGVALWDVESGARVDARLPDSHTADVTFAPDGHVVTTQPDQVRLLDPTTGEVAETLAAAFGVSVAFSPDGADVAVGTASGEITLLGAATGTVWRTLRGDASIVTVVRFRPDGALIAAVGADKRLRVWEVATGRQLLESAAFADLPTQLDWSPDGARILVAEGPRAWIFHVAPFIGAPATLARRATCVSAWTLDGSGVVARAPDPAGCMP